ANTGLPISPLKVSALAIDPSTPSTLYAVTGSGGVFKSTDAGGTWNANTGLPSMILGVYRGIIPVAIAPTKPPTVYAGTGVGVFSIQVAVLCVGDCRGTRAVAINDLITLVNIALGSAEPAACSDGGLPLGGKVDVSVIIQAVNNALHCCP